MGLFSMRGRQSRSARFRLPIRLHSEYSLTRALRRAPARAAATLRDAAVAATNDARVVAVVLLLAAAALGWEMAHSLKI
jgi:hypothetical protein